MIRFCRQCGASLGPDALYCGECGGRDRMAARERAKARVAVDRELGRRGLAIMTITVGTFGGLILAAAWFPDALLQAATVSFVVDLLIGTIALLLIGKRAWRHALGRRPRLTSLALAVPVAIVTFAIATGYVWALAALFGVSELLFLLDTPTDARLWLVAVALAPLAEEWLCRGSLWTAVRPVTSHRTAIVATAIVFGFLHGLNGLHVLEVPHRFAMGLGLGWLRARSGSLWPCILAHALHNAAALVIA